MNRTHRKIWSVRLGAFVAVAETARARSKSCGSARIGTTAAAALLLAGTAYGQSAPSTALPTGAQVTAGSASVHASGATMNVVQGSARAAINWQSFNIGSAATVNFQQPGRDAVILNRVVGSERSVIDGALNANGQVWLLNANGVLFNRTARVNTAGLLASTLGLSDADFMAGKANFQGNGSGAGVLNLAALNAPQGYVALLGQQVVNEGMIAAHLGSAVLAAGDKVSLNFNGSSLVGVTVDRGVLNALVTNRQAVLADGGLVVLTAKGLDQVMATVVNNTGEVRAQTVAEREGRIFLLGGMESDRIEVGGRVDASAPNRGQGGFVETSAARVAIADDASVTTHSSTGLHGQWLIDPYDFTIAATGGDITGAALGAALANNNVTIQALSGSVNCTGVSGCGTGNASGNGDIFVNDNITKSSGASTTLTLQADRSISIADGVSISSTSNGLNVHLSANNDGSNAGSVTVGNNSSIRTNGGNVRVGGALTAGVPAADRTVDVSVNGGGATIDAGTGDITFNVRGLTLASYSNLKGRNITVDSESITLNNAPGVKVTATNALSLLSTQLLALSGAYQPAGGSAYITRETQTEFNAGTSMTLSGQSVRVYGSALRLTNTGTNTLNITSQGGISFRESSVEFAGVPNLTIALQQGTTQAVAIAGLNNNYTTLTDYLSGTGTTPLQLALSSGLDLRGSHFGLDGRGYNFKFYSDTAPIAVAPKSIDNGNLAFGTGLEDSVNPLGNLQQPFYYDPNFNQWFKLTFRDYPLDIAVGLGGTSTATWNGDGEIISTSGGTSSLSNAISNLTIDTSGLVAGIGRVAVSYDITAPTSSSTIRMGQLYTLGAGDRFIKTTTTMTNPNTTALENVRLWLGTRDDYIAITDSNFKTKGNITANGFEAITAQDQQSRSVLISQFDPVNDGVTGSAVVFHSTNNDADTSTARCCNFNNVTNIDPRTSSIVTPLQDGSYALFMNYANLDAGASRPTVWYYGVAPLSDVNSLVSQIIAAGGTEPDRFLFPEPPPAPAPQNPIPSSVIADVVNVNAPPVPAPLTAARLDRAVLQRPSNVVNIPAGLTLQAGSPEDLLIVSSLEGDVPNNPVTLSQAQQMVAGSAAQGGTSSNSDDSSSEGGNGEREVRVPAGRNSLVQIVNGGVKLPSGVEQQLFVIKK